MADERRFCQNKHKTRKTFHLLKKNEEIVERNGIHKRNGSTPSFVFHSISFPHICAIAISYLYYYIQNYRHIIKHFMRAIIISAHTPINCQVYRGVLAIYIAMGGRVVCQLIRRLCLCLCIYYICISQDHFCAMDTFNTFNTGSCYSCNL